MKKAVFILVTMLAANFVFAQSDKYIKTMELHIAELDTTHTSDALLDLANTFERIGDAEKTQWLPYYYAALAHANAGTMLEMNSDGSMGGNSAKTDPEADKADALLTKAQALTKDNSEIWIVKKMIATVRLMGDPMSRYMTYGPQGTEAMENAKKLNPDNPRVYLLEGQDKFYTPEQYGGSKEEAKKLFNESMEKFQSFKPASSIDPNWGMTRLRYYLSQVQ